MGHMTSLSRVHSPPRVSGPVSLPGLGLERVVSPGGGVADLVEEGVLRHGVAASHADHCVSL